MKDKDLIAQAVGVPTMYFDGFRAYRKINGVLRCVGFTLDSGAQLNLIISITGAQDVDRDIRRCLDEASSMDGTGALAH